MLQCVAMPGTRRMGLLYLLGLVYGVELVCSRLII